jgi:hypothetical protein
MIVNACFPFISEANTGNGVSFQSLYQGQADFIRLSNECYVNAQFHLPQLTQRERIESHFLSQILSLILTTGYIFGTSPSQEPRSYAHEPMSEVEILGTKRGTTENDNSMTAKVGIAILQGRSDLLDQDEIQRAIKELSSPQQMEPVQSTKFYPSVYNLVKAIRSTTCVPPNTFLWHMVYQATQIHSPLSPYRFTNSFPAFLQYLWEFILKTTAECWSNQKTIPFVYVGDFTNLEILRSQEGGDPTANDLAALSREILPIDLRAPLVHQKLHLINICIQCSKILNSVPDPPSEDLFESKSNYLSLNRNNYQGNVYSVLLEYICRSSLVRLIEAQTESEIFSTTDNKAALSKNVMLCKLNHCI